MLQSKYFLCLIIPFLLSACQPARHFSQFSAHDVSSSERPVFGQINATYRTHDVKQYCKITFNDNPKQTYNIDKTGTFIGILPVGMNEITQFHCAIGPRTTWSFRQLTFNVHPDTHTTDIGTLSFHMGDPDLERYAIRSIPLEIADTILFSLPSQKLKDAHILAFNHQPLTEDERKEFMLAHPALHDVNNGKFINAVTFPTMDEIEMSGKLPN